MKIVIPRADSLWTKVVLAPMPDLSGAVLGILDNGKPNAGFLLSLLADKVQQALGVEDRLVMHKGLPSTFAPPEMLDTLASECGAVLFASAD